MRKCTMCKQEKPDEQFVKPDRDFFKVCDACREYSREYNRWYRATYPEKCREGSKRSHAKYRADPKNLATEKQWRQSKKGKESRRKARTKYRASEKGKETERAYARHQREEYGNKHKDKIAARSAISNALRDGRLERPFHCKICGCVARLHAHHHLGWKKEHYYDVWWVCRICDPHFGSKLVHDGSLMLEQARALIIPTLEDQ